MNKKYVFLFVVLLLFSICMVSILLNIFAIQRSKKINFAINDRNYDELISLCQSSSLGINRSPTFSVFFKTVTDGIIINTPLETAVRNNDTKAVEILLKNGANPNKNSRLMISGGQIYPLERAIAQGNLKMVELLIEYGANVDKSAYYGIEVLSRMGYTKRKSLISIDEFGEMCQLLTDKGARLDWSGIAQSSGRGADVEIFTYLISNNYISANNIYDDEKTILHICCRSSVSSSIEKKEFVLFCKKIGVNLFAEDAFGKTAYDYAIENGYTEIAELLKN